MTGATNPSPNGAVSYAYDAVGNRLPRTSTLPGVPSVASYSYDRNDRLSSDNWDNNGNTVSSNGRAYQYDAENRIASATGGGLPSVTIVYDGDGNRVAKTVNGVTTRYLVDDNNHSGYAQVVEELQGGAVVRQYTYGHDLISQRQQIGFSTVVSFYGYDGHGSVRYLTDAGGAITDRYDYDAFGSLITQVGTTPNLYLYAGEQWDPDLGLYFNRARYLNVGTGRFHTMDTFEGGSSDPTSLHKYLYSNANPINGIDPTGHFTLADAFIALSVISIANSFATFIADPSASNAGWLFLDIALAALPGVGAGISNLVTKGGRFAKFLGKIPLLSFSKLPFSEKLAYLWAQGKNSHFEMWDNLFTRIGKALGLPQFKVVDFLVRNSSGTRSMIEAKSVLNSGDFLEIGGKVIDSLNLIKKVSGEAAPLIDDVVITCTSLGSAFKSKAYSLGRVVVKDGETLYPLIENGIHKIIEFENMAIPVYIKPLFPS